MHEKSTLKPVEFKFDKLTEDGQLRLLDLALDPLVFGISCIPFCAVAFAIWAYSLKASITGLVIWAVFYVFAAIGIRLLQKSYLNNRKSNNYQLVFAKWLPIIKAIALAHGIGLTLPFFILMGQISFEFNLLYLLTVGGIIAAFATHLTPIIIAFLYLFIPCWGICLLIMPWVFPAQWPILLLLSIIYAMSMYKHALLGHQFFLKQIVLEDEGAQLAENYRLAKIEAESALQAKNQFLTTASHDLRQPVHAMGFLIESIARRNQDASLIPALKDLKQSVRSVTQMFNSLLDLSKMESGAVQLHIEAITLNSLLQDTAMVFAEEAKSKNLALRVKLVSKNAVVMADMMLLKQSLTNLMHNALRYTKQGGVLIAARKRGNEWQLEVWDTGVGIATDEQNQVYSPFFRNKHAWQIDSAGHGLGLAVVARCCDLMSAEYGLSSRLGHGSRFWLSLPAAKGVTHFAKSLESQNDSRAEPMQHLLKGTCLVVDDDPQVINAWQSLLCSWGVDVRCAESATQAIALLDDGFMPQAIFCDQRLRAGESGFDVLRALLARCPQASGAMISGEFDSPELLEAENEGYLVLQKPLEPEALFTLLSRWLGEAKND